MGFCREGFRVLTKGRTMFAVGKVSDKTLATISGTYGSGDPPDVAILANVIADFGGVAADYSILHISDTSAKAKRVMEGDDFDLVWTGNVLTDLDFASREDTKRWIDVGVSKASILADNTDSLTLTLGIWKADKTGLATNQSTTVDLPVSTPLGICLIRCVFVNGVN